MNSPVATDPALMHPRDIRRQAQLVGVRFPYDYPRHQGTRETSRRRAKLRLCDEGCGEHRFGSSNLCSDCLEKRWADMRP